MYIRERLRKQRLVAHINGPFSYILLKCFDKYIYLYGGCVPVFRGTNLKCPLGRRRSTGAALAPLAWLVDQTFILIYKGVGQGTSQQLVQEKRIRREGLGIRHLVQDLDDLQRLGPDSGLGSSAAPNIQYPTSNNLVSETTLALSPNFGEASI